MRDVTIEFTVLQNPTCLTKEQKCKADNGVCSAGLTTNFYALSSSWFILLVLDKSNASILYTISVGEPYMMFDQVRTSTITHRQNSSYDSNWLQSSKNEVGAVAGYGFAVNFVSVTTIIPQSSNGHVDVTVAQSSITRINISWFRFPDGLSTTVSCLKISYA
uniref:Uncharacterized protein n=1 Tax=Romanomermis culicivorax TaxID=13658 RepID=A0A915HHV3_ROMCU